MRVTQFAILIAGCCGAAVVSVPQPCVAAVFSFNDREAFESSNPGLTIVDFEQYASSGEVVQLAPPIPGVRILGTASGSPSEGLVSVAASDSPWADPSFMSPTAVALVNALSGYKMTFEFDPPVNAVGMNINIGFDENLLARVRSFREAQELTDVSLTTTNDFAAFTGIVDPGGDNSVDGRRRQTRTRRLGDDR